MAFLNENEWIRLNEIAYNISFIYTVEEMQHEIRLLRQHDRAGRSRHWL